MRGFLDTNIILDVIWKREPFFDSSLKVIQIFRSPGYLPFIAWHSLSNLFYLTSSKETKAKGHECVKEVLSWALIPTTSTETAQRALGFGLGDFEDALQLASAQACRADVLITRNVKDFQPADADIQILFPEQFLASVSG